MFQIRILASCETLSWWISCHHWGAAFQINMASEYLTKFPEMKQSYASQPPKRPFLLSLRSHSCFSKTTWKRKWNGKGCCGRLHIVQKQDTKIKDTAKLEQEKCRLSFDSWATLLLIFNYYNILSLENVKHLLLIIPNPLIFSLLL